jgi:putative membrane protein
VTNDHPKIVILDPPETSKGHRTTNPESSPVSYHSRISLVLKGFCMGTADVIPGVSGGTMAFILGIYSELINAIKSFDRIWLISILKLNITSVICRPHFRFLLPLFTGILFALIFFTRVIPLPKLLMDYPEQVYGLFFGLITGSCYVLLRNINKLKLNDSVFIVIGVIPGILLFNIGPFTTPDTSLYIFLSGCLAISAMLLPGVSGSFILLILNKYAYIFNAIGYFNFFVLLPFAAGMLTGLAVFSRIISWVLNKYYRQTTLIINGILIASLWLIWPFQVREYEVIGAKSKLVSLTPVMPMEINLEIILIMLLIVVGISVVIVLNILGTKKLTNN